MVMRMKPARDRDAGDFMPQSVAAGCNLDEFRDLPPEKRRKIVRLMARVSEASYRRGLQHGVVLRDRLAVDPAKLRFDVSLDRSPFTDSGGGFTSCERLSMEYPLRGLGLE